MTSEDMKRFQSTVSMMRWFDAQGGHVERQGVSPEGKIIDVPLHRHHVKLNIFRVDVGLKYQLSPQWVLEASVPYETKAQEATVEELDPVTPEQWNAILRNGNNHHRNETYTGLADADILLARHIHGIFKEDDFFIGRVGTTIPFGKTEEDPWKLGDAGREHLHIQFGTGTFNPIIGLHYSLPLYKGLGANASIRGKFPFYENSKTYRAPRELTYTGGLNYRFNDWLSVQASYLGFYQTYAYWAGELDINTGLLFNMASVGASVVTPYNIPVSVALVLPLSQRTLYEESDAFEFGPLVSLTVLYSF